MAGAFLIPPALLLTSPASLDVRSRRPLLHSGSGFGASRSTPHPIVFKTLKKLQQMVPNWEELLDMRK